MADTKPIHSKLGASSAERWTECPGSIRLIEELGAKSVETIFAQEGTAAHELAEKVLHGPPNAYWYLNQKAVFNKIPVTEEMADAVQLYVDYCWNLRNEINGTMLIEHRFQLPHLHPLFYGTADCVIYKPFGDLHVIDFKYGEFLSVEVEKNLQLIYYALGAIDLTDFNRIFIHVVQPRADHEDGPTRVWETNRAELIEFSKYLKAKALETQKSNATLKEGDHCRFCPAAVHCPQIHKKAIQVAHTTFDDPKVPEVTALTKEQIAKVVQAYPMISAWLKNVKAHALTLLEKGQKVEGIKLVRGRGSRSWIDERMTKAELGELVVIEKLMTPAQAEKLFGVKEVKMLVKSNRGNLTVAGKDDKRAEVELLPEIEFDF